MGRSNEELAVAIQQGDSSAADQLVRQNRGLLAQWANGIQTQYALSRATSDLMQEGFIALLDAAKTFDPDRGVKLMTYAGAAIQQAMKDCAAAYGSVLSIPLDRLRQLRHTAYVSAMNSEQVAEAIAKKLGVSLPVANKLRIQAGLLLTCDQLSKYKNTPSDFCDPESVYEENLLSEHLSWLIDFALSAREQTLVRYYFGLGEGYGRGMNLEDIAAFLNYNDRGGARKALKKAVTKLRAAFYSDQYGAWCAAKHTIRLARRDAGVAEESAPPQVSWIDAEETTERFLSEVCELIRVHEVLSDELQAGK